jgi:hypothetical protein
MAENATSKAASWILWWRLSPEQVDKQAQQYDGLGFFKSARGWAATCLLISGAMTLVLVAMKVSPAISILDVVLMLIFGGFIYAGHRWASIAAMVLWTLEKGVLLAGSLSGGTHSAPGSALSHALWWCVYMHAFYLAFRVERRRRIVSAAADVF